ncbi:MAG: MMPL family transporter [Cryobacterium sp.]|nr:MMPL family transporter [Cryobacterium sp.]
MATLLYRLGKFSFQHPWRVLISWILLLVIILGGGIMLGGKSQESFVIPGTESQVALDRLNAVFPEVSGASAEAVYQAPEGKRVDSETFKSAIIAMASTIRSIPGVNSVTTPFDEYAGKQISDNGSIAISRIQFEGSSSEITDATLAKVTSTAKAAEALGLRVEFGGQVFADTTFGITVTEIFGVVFAGIVLLITFGSLLAAGMPLLSALIGVGIVIGGISGVSLFVEVSSSAPLLALMIGLAVGIDYTLFILSRHRAQLAGGESVEESAAKAVGTAGSAVVFAGLTVIVALLGLLVVGIPFLSVMGIGAAFAVLVAMAVATTLLPALLRLAGERLRPKPNSKAARRAGKAGDRTMGRRWVRGVLKHPILASIGVLAILGTVAIPAFDLKLALPDGSSEPANSTQRQAYDLISSGFGPGFNGPLIVAVDITQTTNFMNDLDEIASKIRNLDGVEWVSGGLPDTGLDTAIIQVVPSSAPEAEQTARVVKEIRDLAPEILKNYSTPMWVTGTTAVAIDISSRLDAALLPFGAVVVGLSILLLMIVFRSLLVPLKAAAGFLLSVLAAFGVTVAVFQWGWFGEIVGLEKAGPILSFMPIILMAVLFGLAMDYEVFLVSGMREEYIKLRTRGLSSTAAAKQAIPSGFANGARVVTAAALIMFFVFFAFVPEGAGMIKPIALGLAVGIAFDAFLVRMTLGPALMALMGRFAWWIPNRVSRHLPDIDIEGEGLRSHLDEIEWSESKAGYAIVLENVVAGVDEARIGPFNLSIRSGSLVRVSGKVFSRWLLAITIAGRLPLIEGRAVVAGRTLPSSMRAVRKKVAIASLQGFETESLEMNLLELVTERIRLTRNGIQSIGAKAQANAWLTRIRVGLKEFGIELDIEAGISSMDPLNKAVAIACVALSERPEIVMVDLGDGVADESQEARLLSALNQISPAGTTVILGAEQPWLSKTTLERKVVDIELSEAEARTFELIARETEVTRGEER